jgi:hypothetical protein
MTLTNFSDLQVVTSFCSDKSDEGYWLFHVYRGEDSPRVYRLPELPCDWPANSRWNHLEDRKPLLSIVQSCTLVF